jgi:hypothetical protein
MTNLHVNIKKQQLLFWEYLGNTAVEMDKKI